MKSDDCCGQAADRRDRLIYVLSQIKAARGDDAIPADEDSSSSDSEADVSVLHPLGPFSFEGDILTLY
jgi:hypothetical protein